MISNLNVNDDSSSYIFGVGSGRRLRLLVLLSILCGSIFAALIFGPSSIQSFIRREIESKARNSGIPIFVGSVGIGFSAIEAKNLELSTGRFSFPIKVDELRAYPALLSLLTLRPSYNLESKLYSGEITALLNHDEELAIDIKGIELKDVHPMRWLSLSSGILSGEASLKLPVKSSRDIESVSLSISNLRKDSSTAIPKNLLKIDLPLRLPAFEDGSFNFVASKKGKLLSIDKAEFVSSLGNLNFEGSLSGETIEGRLKVEKGSGDPSLYSLLRLALASNLPEEEKSFRVAISGNLRSPTIRIQPKEH